MTLSTTSCFYQLADSSPEAVMGVTHHGKIVVVNINTENLLRVSADEIVGRQVSLFFPEWEWNSDTQLTPSSRVLDTVVKSKDGVIFPVEVSVSVVSADYTGEVDLWIIIREVSERTLVLDASPDAMIVVDHKGIIVRVNKHAETLFGYKDDEMLGNLVEMLLPLRYHDIHPKNRNEYYQHPRVRPMGAGLELLGKKKDNSEFTAEISLNPIKTRHGLCVVAAVRNISERRTQERIERQNLVILETNRQNFIANISHEMRTPLNQILGITQLLLDTQLCEAQTAYLRQIQTSGSDLLTLIDSVINYAVLSKGADINVKAFDLYKTVYAHVETFRELASKKGIELRNNVLHDKEEFVYGDVEKILQVLTALIDNAIKFTESGHVEVKLIEDKKSDTLLSFRCEVGDTGIGIPKGIRLFDHYSPVDASFTRPRGGTGIGLLTSRKVIDLMRGTLNYTSQVGIGSVFWFNLELGKVSFVSNPAMPSERSSGSSEPIQSGTSDVITLPKNTLVVDDNPINLHVFVKFLQKLKLPNIDSAINGQIAYDKTKSDLFDLVFMDLQMPVMDGFEATRRIREYEKQHRPGHHTVIVAVTAYGTETKKAALDSGMDDFLSKPVSLAQIEAIFGRHFSKSN